MIIQKGEREYIVTELAHEWKAERNVGGVSVSYRIPKEAAPDAEAVERYIMENDEVRKAIRSERDKPDSFPDWEDFIEKINKI